MSKYGNVDELTAQIDLLENKRKKLDTEIRNLRKQRTRLNNGTVVGEDRSGTQDNLAVPTVELRTIVMDALRERTYHQLAASAGVSPRTIAKIRENETRFTTLRIADMILNACGHPEALGLSVRIVGNPQYRSIPSEEDCGT